MANECLPTKEKEEEEQEEEDTSLHIVLYATEVGNILGKNPFCSRTETLKRVWYRLKKDEMPEHLRPLPDQLQAITRTKTGQKFRRRKCTIQQYAKFDRLVSELKKSLEDEGRPELMTSVEGFVRTEMGRNSETLAIDIANDNPAIGPCRSMQQRYCKLTWQSQVHNVDVLIAGRIDGLDRQDRVVEIKTRLGRRLGIAPNEMIQLQTYLFLTGAPAGYVAELYEGHRLKIGPLTPFDDAWWHGEVIPALGAFAVDLTTSVMTNTLTILLVEEDEKEKEKDISSQKNGTGNKRGHHEVCQRGRV